MYGHKMFCIVGNCWQCMDVFLVSPLMFILISNIFNDFGSINALKHNP